MKTVLVNNEIMFHSLLIKFSENRDVWPCAVVNEYKKYFLEVPTALKPCGRAAALVVLLAAVKALIHLLDNFTL